MLGKLIDKLIDLGTVLLRGRAPQSIGERHTRDSTGTGAVVESHCQKAR